MDIDFNTLDTGEDLSTDSHSAVFTAERLRLEKELRILAQTHGKKLLSKPMFSREAANPVTQLEYNTRLYTLLHIIRNPELTEQRNPLADTWKTTYTHVPYNDKATNWNISKKDRESIVTLLKELGMYKRFVCDSVKSVIERVTDYYKTQKISMLEEKVRTLELRLEDNGNIWYRGVEIKKLARVYKVVIGDFELSTRHGTFEKMDDFLKQVDKLLG